MPYSGLIWMLKTKRNYLIETLKTHYEPTVSKYPIKGI